MGRKSTRFSKAISIKLEIEQYMYVKSKAEAESIGLSAAVRQIIMGCMKKE
jgi:hypothetical protein